jgi:glycosyltransferase involved in cell wall biosynthesis
VRDIKLSICIATYNRAAFIGETLDSILPQVTDEVEVVIVDGASTDNTAQVIESYAKKYEQLRYHKLDRKGGVDQDYCKAVEYARGEMCWLFSDDDLLKPDAIRRVLQECVHGYSLIVVNSELKNNDMSVLITQRVLQADEDVVYEKNEIEKLYLKVITYVSFIGCIVVNRELWMNRERENYYGTEFIHVGVIFQSPLPGAALLISCPYIVIRYGNAQWSTRSFEIGMIKWPTLIGSFKDISENVSRKFTVKSPSQIVRRLLISRAKNQYTYKEYQKWSSTANADVLIKIAALIIANIPYRVLNKIILLYLKKFRSDNRIAIYDFENCR